MQKLEKSAAAWALTAWRLTDGAPVYWSREGWRGRFLEAEIFHARPEADAALVRAGADVEARLVVAPYLFEIAGAAPATVRERIRAAPFHPQTD